MITIKDIKKVQKPREKERFFGYYVTRKISKYITFLLLRIFGKRNNPNAITVFSLIWGVGGSILLSFPNNFYWVIGSFLCFGFFIWDCIDGEIARILKKESLLGMNLDFLSHPIFNSSFLIFSSLGLSQYLETNFILYLGIFAGILIIISDTILVIQEKLGLQSFSFSDAGWQNKNFFLGAIKSLLSFQGFIFILFLATIIDYLMNFYYLKTFLFFLVYLYVIFLFIKRMRFFIYQLKQKQLK